MLGLCQMNGRMSTQKKKWMVSWNIRNLKGKMIAQMDGWIDGGWIDGWINGQVWIQKWVAK